MRLEGEKIPRENTFNTLVGTVFDAHVKVRLDRKLKLSYLLQEVKDEEAINMGSLLCQVYDKSGALQNLIDAGVGYVELEKEFFVNGVPIYGKPDAIMADGSPLDWKTTLRGSVKPGWTRKISWGLKTGMVMDNQVAPQTIYMDGIDSDWALQLTMYAFLAGHKPGNRLVPQIELIVLQEAAIQLASYKCEVSPAYQHMLWDLTKHIWDAVGRMQIPPPEYDQRRCMMYGKRCEVADKCEAFKRGALTSETMNAAQVLF